MIVAIDGTVRIDGDEPEVFADTAMILNLIYETLKDKKSEEYAMEKLVEIGRIAVMDEDELHVHARRDGHDN